MGHVLFVVGLTILYILIHGSFLVVAACKAMWELRESNLSEEDKKPVVFERPHGQITAADLPYMPKG